MSLFGRALGGIGEAAVNLTNKYIDEDLAKQRAQALAEIQIKSAATMRADADTFNNDPSRVARDRQRQVDDITALGGAKNAVELAGKKAEVEDPGLTAGLAARAGAVAGATTKASTEAQLAAEMKKITDPAYISAERKLALARHVESAGSTAQAALANFQLGVAKNMQDLRGQLAEAQSSGNRDAAEDIQSQIDALDGKGGKVDKFYAVAEKATAGMAAANKILNDPMATPDAKDEANIQIRQQRAILESAAKRAGISNISDAAKVPEADAHKQAADAIARGAPADAVNKRLTDSGYKPLPAKGGTSLMDRAGQSKPADTGTQQMNAAAARAGYTYSRGSDGRDYYRKVVDGQGVIKTAQEVADELGLVY